MTDTPNSTVDLAIGGMSCASCVARIEKALGSVPGVAQASVNLATEKAAVTLAADADFERTRQQLLKAVKALGYKVRLIDRTAPMATEVTRDDGPHDAILSALFSLPLLIPMLGAWLPWHVDIPLAVQAALASVVQFVFGGRFYRGALGTLRHGSAGMDLLVALGTTGAWGLSLYVLLMHRDGGHHAVYFESSSMVITLVLTGRWLERRARHRTRAAIDALQKLQPTTAIRLDDGQETTVAIDSISAGMIVRVRPGQALPADGIVVNGRSHVDESMMTGESQPAARAPGDKVTGGTIALDGQLDIRVTASGQDSTLAGIIAWVERAQAAKAPAQQLADRISAVFVPVVIVLAIVVGIWLYQHGGDVETALMRAVTVLVIACPCALGLATPAALMAGTGAAARAGILIKDIDALDRARLVRVIAFDKTGTLTVGAPRVSSVQVLDGEENTMLASAAALQSISEHPLARAIQAAATERALSLPATSDARVMAGMGITATLDGTPWAIGNAALMKQLNVDTKPAQGLARACSDKGESLAFVARLQPAPLVVGVIGIADQIRSEAQATLQHLRTLGIKTVMITGDNEASARRVGAPLGLTDIAADVRPDAKAATIERLRDTHGPIAMVGDGINDAPALACADLGIALGSGSDIARHSAAITLVGGGIARVPDALEIARLTLRNIRQNLFWAFVYNVVGLPLAAMGLVTPMVAGAAMAASSISVVSNALRLNRWKPRSPTP